MPIPALVLILRPIGAEPAAQSQNLVDVAQRKQTPKHLRWIDLTEPERAVPLAPKRKRLLATIKMIAYRAETALAGLLPNVMARSDDRRALLREIFATEADLIPDEEAGTLTVALHHLTSRASDEAARFLAGGTSMRRKPCIHAQTFGWSTNWSQTEICRIRSPETTAATNAACNAMWITTTAGK